MLLRERTKLAKPGDVVGDDVDGSCILERQLEDDHVETIRFACGSNSLVESGSGASNIFVGRTNKAMEALCFSGFALTPAKDAVQR